MRCSPAARGLSTASARGPGAGVGTARRTGRRAAARGGTEEWGALSELEARPTTTEPEPAGDAAIEPGADRARGDYFVQSLERGLAVIRAFSADEPELTLSDIARRTGMTRAAARRFVLTLVDLGYVGVEDRRFHLLPTVLELGYTYLSLLSFPQVATPHLTTLSERLKETTSIAVLDGDDVVYVAWVGPRRVVASGISIGTRAPAWLTSHGRAQLAGLSDEALDAYLARTPLVPRTARTTTDPAVLRQRLTEVRAQGYALVDQELEEGVTSIAVPIRDAAGAVVASVNVGTHARRKSPAVLKKTSLALLQETAAQIERDMALLGVRATPPGQL